MLHLSHDLTAAGVDAVSGAIASLRKDGAALQEQLKATIEAMNGMRARMAPQTAM